MPLTNMSALGAEDLYTLVERETTHCPVICLYQPGSGPLYVIAARFIGALHTGRVKRGEFVDIVWSAPTMTIIAADSVVHV